LAPDGLSLRAWNGLKECEKLYCKLPCGGHNQKVADFPLGLPSIISQSPELNRLFPTGGSAMAKAIQGLLDKHPYQWHKNVNITRLTEPQFKLIENFVGDKSDFKNFIESDETYRVIRTVDNNCIATLEKRTNFMFYKLQWKEGKYIGEFVEKFSVTDKNIEQFNDGTKEVARRLRIFIETNNLRNVPQYPPPFGELTCNKPDILSFINKENSQTQQSPIDIKPKEYSLLNKLQKWTIILSLFLLILNLIYVPYKDDYNDHAGYYLYGSQEYLVLNYELIFWKSAIVLLVSSFLVVLFGMTKKSR